MLAVGLFARQIAKQMSCSLSTITRFTAAQTAQKMQDVVDGRLSVSTVRRRLRFISVYSIRPFRVNNLTVIRRQNRSAAVDMYGNDGCIRIWRRRGEQ